MSPLQTPSAPLEIVAVLLLFVVPAIAGYKCAKGHDKRLWLTFLSFVLGWIGFIVALLVVIVKDLKDIKAELASKR